SPFSPASATQRIPTVSRLPRRMECESFGARAGFHVGLRALDQLQRLRSEGEGPRSSHGPVLIGNPSLGHVCLGARAEGVGPLSVELAARSLVGTNPHVLPGPRLSPRLPWQPK